MFCVGRSLVCPQGAIEFVLAVVGLNAGGAAGRGGDAYIVVLFPSFVDSDLELCFKIVCKRCYLQA